MTAVATQAPKILRGSYVGRNIDAGLDVGCDMFEIAPAGDGWRIDSEQVFFGRQVPRQRCSFEVDAAWNPLKLDVHVNEQRMLAISFGPHEATMKTWFERAESETRVPVERSGAFALVSGAFALPMLLMRRYDFERNEPQTFFGIPGAVGELRRIDDGVLEGVGPVRQLRLRMSLGQHNDTSTLAVDPDGELRAYWTENQRLYVRLENNPW
jgi:hypothetical protein